MSQNLRNIYDLVGVDIQEIKDQEIIKNQWRALNPYFEEEYQDKEAYYKNLLEILDEFFDNILDYVDEEFLIPITDERFANMYRGRRGKWHKKIDLAAPSIEVAKANDIINRWNPPDRRYLYVVYGEDSNNDFETICEELRLLEGEEITIARFKVNNSAYGSVLDLNYENVCREELFRVQEEKNRKFANDVVEYLKDNNLYPTSDILDFCSNKFKPELKRQSAILCGKVLIKSICDVIFIPLDKDEDADKNKKDICYKSFHILSEYLERKGIVGIIYPSTRMKLIGKNGNNLVMFNADDAEAQENEFRTFYK